MTLIWRSPVNQSRFGEVGVDKPAKCQEVQPPACDCLTTPAMVGSNVGQCFSRCHKAYLVDPCSLYLVIDFLCRHTLSQSTHSRTALPTTGREAVSFGRRRFLAVRPMETLLALMQREKENSQQHGRILIKRSIANSAMSCIYFAGPAKEYLGIIPFLFLIDFLVHVAWFGPCITAWGRRNCELHRTDSCHLAPSISMDQSPCNFEEKLHTKQDK